MFGSVPTPHRTPCVGAARLDVGDGGRVRALTHRVLGVVDDVERRAEAVAQRVDERVDRSVALAGDRARLAVDDELRGDRRAARRESLRSSCDDSRNRGSSTRYSDWNASHITTGLISVPESSVMCWMFFENSICRRRGRSNPCSVFITYATPPLPLWLLTRMTAS